MSLNIVTQKLSPVEQKQKSGLLCHSTVKERGANKMQKEVKSFVGT